MDINYYQILDIDEDATLEEIKKAYRKCVLKFHPDMVAGNDDKFRDIVTAYQALTKDNGTQSVESIFQSMFSSVNKSNIDIKITTRIDFRDALLGGSHKITFTKKIICPECKGETCIKCNNTGYISKNAKLKFDVPPHLSPYSKILISGQGNEIYDNGTKTVGDVVVVIDFPSESKGLIFKNNSLYLTVNVPLDLAIAEDTIDIYVFPDKVIKLTLDHTMPTGHTYSVKDNIVKGFCFIKVLLDIPKNKLDKKKRIKLVNILRGVYGKSSQEIKPLSS